MFALVTSPLGLLLGRFPGSLPMVIMGANWLLEGGFENKWKALKNNVLFYSLIALFLLYLLGLFYATHVGNAIEEIRIALPMIALPLMVLSSGPIGKAEVKWTLIGLIVGCFLNTLWCFIYGFVLHHVEEGRNLSRFMSHIRLGMLIDLAIMACVYLFLLSGQARERLLYLLCVVYFVLMLFVLSLMSGLVMLFILVLICALYYFYKQKTVYKIATFIFVFLFLFMGLSLVLQLSASQLQSNDSVYNEMKKQNTKGRAYICFDSLGVLENGHYVYRNIQLEDLRRTWNYRVPEDSFSYNPEHNIKRYYVLLRYLSSAALSKDEEGVKALTDKDIQSIRHNITNVDYVHWWYMHKRLYELVNEYADFKNGGEVNGHSFALRIRYWKAAVVGIQANLFFGVGSGDVQQSLENIYEKHFPEISKKYYLKPHNQFLTVTLAYGLIGLLVFLWLLFFPIFYLRKYLSPMYVLFFVVLLLSFITEDTLGTQAGLGFYSIFNTLFCAEAYFKKRQILGDLPESH